MTEKSKTLLEHLLHVHLWSPSDALKRAQESLPTHARRKEYREAAECQHIIRKAEIEIERWKALIEVAEKERNLLERVSEYFGDSCTHPLANEIRQWLYAYPEHQEPLSGTDEMT